VAGVRVRGRIWGELVKDSCGLRNRILDELASKVEETGLAGVENAFLSIISPLQSRETRSYLGTGRMEVFDAELWAIGLALDVTIEKRETLQKHGVKTVAVFSDSQAAIRRMAHLEPGPGQRLARRINRRAQALLAHGIATEIHWVPGHSGIPGNEEADHQANLARDGSGSTVRERPYTSASKALQLQTRGQGGDQETSSDDKREVAGYQVLQTKVRACTRGSLPKTVRPPRGR